MVNIMAAPFDCLDVIRLGDKGQDGVSEDLTVQLLTRLGMALCRVQSPRAATRNGLPYFVIS